MQITPASNQATWDSFLTKEVISPFLQSWTMGEVYRECGQEPVRLEVRDGDQIVGICQALIVNARRGKHLSIPYGPVGSRDWDTEPLIESLKEKAKEAGCSFIRMSPFAFKEAHLQIAGSRSAPLHLLAEHLWHLPLSTSPAWSSETATPRSEEEVLMGMRKTTRNLVRRAEKEGVRIERSTNPNEDIKHFLQLHEITRKRHGFTPYTDTFFRLQLEKFAARDEATLYLAWYQDEVIASSIHMHMGGETSYHHGASSHVHPKIPASYLLQWTAIKDAIARGDHVYNFWGIAPVKEEDGKMRIQDKKHPFAGVTTFKTGFGGELRELQHCFDIPVSQKYWVTWGIEVARKWKRGF